MRCQSLALCGYKQQALIDEWWTDTKHPRLISEFSSRNNRETC